MKNHQLIGPKRQYRESETVAVRKLHFARPVLIQHHYITDRSAAQENRLTAGEVQGRYWGLA